MSTSLSKLHFGKRCCGVEEAHSFPCRHLWTVQQAFFVSTLAQNDARMWHNDVVDMQELDRRRDLPGDPYGFGGQRQLNGVPVFHEAPWISNMTTIQLQNKVLAYDMLYPTTCLELEVETLGGCYLKQPASSSVYSIRPSPVCRTLGAGGIFSFAVCTCQLHG